MAPASAETLRLLALGDSLTAGYNLPAGQGFVPRLEQALRESGYDVEVIDGGVSGDTSAGGLARLDWMLGEHVDAAIVELGANDGLRGLDPAETYRNLDAIITQLHDRNIKVMLAGMYAPPNLGRQYGEDFRATFTRLAEEHDIVFYPFFLEGVAMQPELNLADGIHPNEAGINIIVESILPYVKELLDRVKVS
ncbi:arylesterase [Telmatospirillum sp. J64-1]|uniref:arylesterase n=1 Tax=Telmatospirillum sp. J64-1 TaxID=2502183 RepID=UPI00115D22A8|nr:arylesterase [Telmatospirillum sp. J64-1]